MQTLNFIGNGSAFSDSINNCAYFKKDKYFLLLDCGEDVYKQIKNTDLLKDINTIDIWISHLHGDHAGSLSTFIFHCYYILNIKPNIIMTKDFGDLNTYLKITGCKKYCNIKQINSTASSHEIIESIYKTSHVKDIPSYSILLNVDGKKIFYSGDCNDLPHIIVKLFEIGKIDELYVDTSYMNYPNSPHMNIDKLYNIINGKYNDRVYCMHIDSIKLIDKIKEYKFNMVKTLQDI